LLLQRRYQKIIDDSLQKKMGDMAVRLAKQCCYENAGTARFSVDKNGSCYFMEMNTRIQMNTA
jgi:acetyl-CoA carboxylase biotin carboxylase subunit